MSGSLGECLVGRVGECLVLSELFLDTDGIWLVSSIFPYNYGAVSWVTQLLVHQQLYELKNVVFI